MSTRCRSRVGAAAALPAIATLLTAPSLVVATPIGITFTETTGLGVVGSNTIDAAPGDFLTAIVTLLPDAGGVSNYGVSLLFDQDLGDELDLISAQELSTAPLFNFTVGCSSTQESSSTQAGGVSNCEAVTIGLGPVTPGTIEIVRLVFQATANVATDGADIQTGLFATGLDGIFDNAGIEVADPVFGAAVVNRLPEPRSLLLFAIGLAGLTLYRPPSASI